MTENDLIPPTPSEEDYLARAAAAPSELATNADPIALFESWLAEADLAERNDPNAVVLATVDGDGLPDDPDADVSGLADGVGGRPPARPADAYTTVAVSAVVPGQALLVLRAPAARHTGVEVDETIEER